MRAGKQAPAKNPCATRALARQFPLVCKGIPLNANRSPVNDQPVAKRRGGFLILAGVASLLVLVSVQGPGIAQVPSAGATGAGNAMKATQEGYVGSGACAPCHQSIFDKFAKT